MDSPKVEINISQLRNAINAILDHIEHTLDFNNMPLKKDYYYYISDDYKYNMSADPADYLIGQLHDDWKVIKSVANDSSLATPVSLMHLAPILGYLATQVDWYAPKPTPPTSLG